MVAPETAFTRLLQDILLAPYQSTDDGLDRWLASQPDPLDEADWRNLSETLDSNPNRAETVIEL